VGAWFFLARTENLHRLYMRTYFGWVRRPPFSATSGPWYYADRVFYYALKLMGCAMVVATGLVVYLVWFR